MWIVKTSVDPLTGVIGLNGDFYILDDDGEVMEFATEEEARAFIAEFNPGLLGADPDNEYIDYVER
tara:strand:+ start:331 stop:528 length:198 start_codon:yes stop_codon:yes gene_type:complete